MTLPRASLRRSPIAPGISSTDLAEAFARGLRGSTVAEEPTRSSEHRASYANNPAGYIVDILGGTLTKQQRRALESVLDVDRLAIPAGNNLGKTWLLAALAVWFVDSVGSRRLPNGEEEGARLLLPGVSGASVRATIWSEMLQHMERARSRGHAMPGRIFEGVNLTTLWRVRAGWTVEMLSPPKRPGEKQAHSAAGRHARNQWAIIEEGAGVPAALWTATLGMCSGYGNKILTAYNPTERSGYVYELVRSGGWRVLVLSALDHPNVIERRPVIHAAVSHTILDDDIRASCTDMGPANEVVPQPEHLDFVYALPPLDTDDDEPRADGIRGHRDGEPRVYRPTGQFAPRRLGEYPRDDSAGMFDPVAWDAGVARWLAAQDPERSPDRVGIDAAGGGGDEAMAAPAWGPDADTLLEMWSEMAANRDTEGMAKLQAEGRARVGRLVSTGASRGPEIATAAIERWPRSWWVAEDTGDGKSLLDHAEVVLHHTMLQRIHPSGAPPKGHPLPEETLCGNFRASMYERAAMLVRRGLVDPPDDPRLRQEIMAIERKWGSVKLVDGVNREVAYLIPKKWLRHRLGRSTDRADAFVLALCRAREEEPDFEIL